MSENFFVVSEKLDILCSYNRRNRVFIKLHSKHLQPTTQHIQMLAYTAPDKVLVKNRQCGEKLIFVMKYFSM